MSLIDFGLARPLGPMHTPPKPKPMSTTLARPRLLTRPLTPHVVRSGRALVRVTDTVYAKCSTVDVDGSDEGSISCQCPIGVGSQFWVTVVIDPHYDIEPCSDHLHYTTPL